jgi:hypothetical protein
MSTIKLNGTTSGSSIIKAPDSGSTNQTFTLPASSGTLVTTTDAGVAGITSAADATAITIDSSENVGIGTASPDSKLHVFNGETSITADVDADDIIVENNGACGITIGSANNSTGSIRFADDSQSRSGMLYYSHITNEMRFYTNQTQQLSITSDGRGLSQFTAKVWVKFNHVGTIAINDSHNVSSLTDQGTGDCTINFSNNMGNTDYCATSGMESISGSGCYYIDTAVEFAVGSLRIGIKHTNGSYYDKENNMVTIFGD